MSDVNANIGVNIDSSQALAELKRLQRQISEFHLSVAKSSEAAALAQKSLQTNFVNSVNSIGAFSAELRTVKTTAESFTSSLENNKLSMREYFRYAGAATKTFGANFKSEFDTIGKVAEERVKKLQTQYIKMGRDANGAMKAIAIRPLTLDMDNLATKTQIAAQKQALFNQLVKQGSTNLLNFGKNTQWAGRQLMVGFTLPLMAFGAAASKSFQQLETEVIKFKKVYGDLGTDKAQTDAALKNIKSLADGYTKYGVEVSKTVGLASQAAAAGFQGADLMAQTEAATKLAILGQIEQQQALETTISLQNAFKISSQDLAGTIDFLNAVENQTVTSLDDITTAIPKVAPVIQQLGGDVKDLAFFLTAMKEGGINASEGANALKSGLASLINPSKKANAMLSDMGININNIVNKNQGNLKATVVEFAKELDKLDPLSRARAIETMFGKFQFARISTLLSNVTQTGNQAAKVLDLAGESAANLANLTTKELGITAESALVKFQASMAKLKASLAPIGEVFMKSLAPVLDFISGVLDKFNGLSDGTKKFIAITVGVVAGLGPILLMTFGLLANGVANIIKLFMTLRTGYQRLTGQSQNLGEQTQYLTSEQLEAAGAAHSLEQSHARLTQQFTVEATAVNQLRVAYQQALAAGAAFAFSNPGAMKSPRKFAMGGIFNGPGNGTSDSIPAMVSTGEAIIPARNVARYPELTAGLVAGKIPGFAFGFDPTPAGTLNVGVESAKDSTGLYRSPSVIKPQTRLNSWGTMEAEIDAMAQAAESYLRELGYSSEQITRKINQLTQKQASHITEQVQSLDVAGKTINVKLWNSDNLITDFGGINNYLNSIHKVTSSLSQNDLSEMAAKLKITIPELETELEKLNNNIHPTTRRAGQVVAALAEKGSNSSDAALAYQSRAVKAGMDVRLEGDFYETVQDRAYDPEKDVKALQQTEARIAKFKATILDSFDISQEITSLAGKNQAALQSAWSQLSIEAKERLVLLSGDAQAFTRALLDEAKVANIAGFELGSSAVKGVARGAKTASPSQATRQTAKEIIEGLRMELAAGQSVVAIAGASVGEVAVQSIDIAVAKESAKSPRRFSERPQGPAPIGLLPNENSIMLPIIAGMTAEEKKREKRRALKEKIKPKFSGGGVAAGMGLMAGSMALNTLPEFTGKAMAQSTLNMASMGAMFGPWGAAAGAAVGLVSSAIGDLLEKERQQKAMQESVFKASSDLAAYFGNVAANTDTTISNFSVTVERLGYDVSNAGKDFGYTTEELAAFKQMLESLPEGNPLKDVIDGLTNEDDPEKIKKIALAFVTTQVALKQINPDQAQKTYDLILSSSNHLAMVGGSFVDFKDRTEAITKTLKNASKNSVTLGESLTQLIATAASSGSLEEMNRIIAGIAASGLNAAEALSAMYYAYLKVGNTQGADQVKLLQKIPGYTAEGAAQILTAAEKGFKYDVTRQTTFKGLLKQYEAWLKANPDAFKDDTNKGPGTGLTKAQTSQLETTKKSIDLLKKKKAEIEAILKAEKAISEQLKKQNDYQQKQLDLDQKIAEAKMSGDYLEAANLEQQKIVNTIQFDYDTKIAKLEADAATIQDQIDKLEEVKTAINDSATKISDHVDDAATKIANSMPKGGGTDKTNTGATKNTPEAIPSDKKTIKSYIDENKPVSTVNPNNPLSPTTTATVNEIDPAKAWNESWMDTIHFDGSAHETKMQLLEDYARSQIPVWGEKEEYRFIELQGSDKQYYTFKLFKKKQEKQDKDFIRIGEPHATPQGLATGGSVKHYEPGGKVNGPGTSTSDSIPAMLSDGEYVVKASAVSQYGVPLLHAINSQKFNVGGMVQKFGSGSGDKVVSKSWWDKLGEKMSKTQNGALGFGIMDQIKSIGQFILANGTKNSGLFSASQKDINTTAETFMVGPIARMFGNNTFEDPYADLNSPGFSKTMDIASIAAAFLPIKGAGRIAESAALTSAEKTMPAALGKFFKESAYETTIKKQKDIQEVIDAVRNTNAPNIARNVKVKKDRSYSPGSGAYNIHDESFTIGKKTEPATVAHETFHHVDETASFESYKKMVRYFAAEKGTDKAVEFASRFYKSYQTKSPSLYDEVQNYLIKNDPESYSYFRGILEGTADGNIHTIPKATRQQLNISDPFKDNAIYGQYTLKNLLDSSARLGKGYEFMRDPSFIKGYLTSAYESAGVAVPSAVKQKAALWADTFNRFGINSKTSATSDEYFDFYDSVTRNNLANGGLIQKFGGGSKDKAVSKSWWDKLGIGMSKTQNGALGFGIMDMVKSLGAVALDSLSNGVFGARKKDINSAAETTLIGPVARALGSKSIESPFAAFLGPTGQKNMDYLSIASTFMPQSRLAEMSALNASKNVAVGVAKKESEMLAEQVAKSTATKVITPSDFELAALKTYVAQPMQAIRTGPYQDAIFNVLNSSEMQPGKYYRALSPTDMVSISGYQEEVNGFLAKWVRDNGAKKYLDLNPQYAGLAELARSGKPIPKEVGPLISDMFPLMKPMTGTGEEMTWKTNLRSFKDFIDNGGTEKQWRQEFGFPDSEVLYGGYPGKNSPLAKPFLDFKKPLGIGEAYSPGLAKAVTDSLDFAKFIAVAGGTGGGAKDAIATINVMPGVKGVSSFRNQLGLKEFEAGWMLQDYKKARMAEEASGGDRDVFHQSGWTQVADEGLIGPNTEYILKDIKTRIFKYNSSEIDKNLSDKLGGEFMSPGTTEQRAIMNKKFITEYIFDAIPKKALGGLINVPKFHNWNGVVPGQYGQELNAVLKSGTEGVYQNEYIAGLKNAAAGNSSTSNANTVYNIDMTVNGGNTNANDIANQVMAKIKLVASQNNQSNKVVM